MDSKQTYALQVKVDGEWQTVEADLTYSAACKLHVAERRTSRIKNTTPDSQPVAPSSGPRGLGKLV